MQRRNYQAEIDRLVSRSADHVQIHDLLKLAGVAPYSRKMIEILELNQSYAFIELHYRIWCLDGTKIGALIFRILEGWEPDTDLIQSVEESVSALHADIQTEEDHRGGTALTGEQIAKWFSKYRTAIPDYFDQLVQLRGGNAPAEVRAKDERVQVPSEYEDLIQR